MAGILRVLPGTQLPVSLGAVFARSSLLLLQPILLLTCKICKQQKRTKRSYERESVGYSVCFIRTHTYEGALREGFIFAIITNISTLHCSDVRPQAAVSLRDDSFDLLRHFVELHREGREAVHLRKERKLNGAGVSNKSE